MSLAFLRPQLSAPTTRSSISRCLKRWNSSEHASRSAPIPANDTMRWTWPTSHRSLTAILIRVTPKTPTANRRPDCRSSLEAQPHYRDEVRCDARDGRVAALTGLPGRQVGHRVESDDLADIDERPL